MKCKKYDQAWFDNQYIQLLNQQCSPVKKLRRLTNLMFKAKKYGIKPVATKESKEKYIREDYGVPKTPRAIRARKARLRRKRKLRK